MQGHFNAINQKIARKLTLKLCVITYSLTFVDEL